MKFRWLPFMAILFLMVTLPAAAQDGEFPPAEIVNDEGGPVVVTGEVVYSNPFFVEGVSEPLVILEDQAGFVDRNRGFLMPPESQVMGQITSDFYTSPFTYSVSLPFEPQATLRDVDNDGETDTGVMIYAVAYWTNTFGDPFLEERDLYGGGWSTAYASTRTSTGSQTLYEYTGGTILVFAPDDGQGFPSGFGADGLLFTEDDPIVGLPQGYTVVNLDTDPFTFDRSREVEIDLIEGEGAEADDFSGMSYTEAFDAMVDKFRREYAFTEFKHIDWDALSAEYRPRVEAAEAAGDAMTYLETLQDLLYQIPDGHVYMSAPLLNSQGLPADMVGGIGMAIREYDDGRVIVNFIMDGGPADEAGIVERAEILEIGGMPVSDYIGTQLGLNPPYSNAENRRLEQARDAVRFPVGEDVEITYRNPGDSAPTTVTLTAIEEDDSRLFSRQDIFGSITGFELPLEYTLLDSGYGYVSIYSFFDNDRLSVILWERMIQTLNANGIPGLIIDMRSNSGGNGFLAEQLAAYFFDEPHVIGNDGRYDEDTGDFFFDPNLESKFFLPPEELRFRGKIAVLVGPGCFSACEFFSYAMTVADRAAIVGQYPTAGLGGGVEQFFMPEDAVVQMTVERAVDAEGNIHIEGTGVVPTVDVPVNEETVFSDGDPVLEAAAAYLDGATSAQISDEGAVVIGKMRNGELEANARDRYTLTVNEDTALTISLTDETGDFDTHLRIYDEDENLIAENDDAGPDTFNSMVTLEVEGGTTLIIEAGTYQDAGEGTYSLLIVVPVS